MYELFKPSTIKYECYLNAMYCSIELWSINLLVTLNICTYGFMHFVGFINILILN